MDEKELYRHVFTSYKELCAQGRQPSSFSKYCKLHGVRMGLMRKILKDEYQPVETLPGYSSMGTIYSRIYESFKSLCEQGKQPSSFAEYCRNQGILYSGMEYYIKDYKLGVEGLPGYSKTMHGKLYQYRKRCKEKPFENVIFEESGFLPADGGGKVITVKVDGNVTVCFPADTDVDTIAKFVWKMRKEACGVGA